jgi:uncharacterized protein with NRDE domain
MCLLAFAWQVHPEYPLVLVANRDEFYARPALAARFWEDAPQVLAGRDEKEGGTWLGVTRSGRWAALTNYREPNPPAGILSRGHLVANFLRGDSEPLAYLQQIAEHADDYSGFNLLVGDRQQAAVLSNRGTAPQLLAAGLYGLSNHLLDSPWPKTQRLKTGLCDMMNQPSIDIDLALHLLTDQTQPLDEELPITGVSVEWERMLATAFIKLPMYGTRASSVLLLGQERARFVEQTWLNGERGELVEFGFGYE